MTGLEKWKEHQHKKIDNATVEEALGIIYEIELDDCDWCKYEFPICNNECEKGIWAYLESEVE